MEERGDLCWFELHAAITPISSYRSYIFYAFYHSVLIRISLWNVILVSSISVATEIMQAEGFEKYVIYLFTEINLKFSQIFWPCNIDWKLSYMHGTIHSEDKVSVRCVIIFESNKILNKITFDWGKVDLWINLRLLKKNGRLFHFNPIYIFVCYVKWICCGLWGSNPTHVTDSF